MPFIHIKSLPFEEPLDVGATIQGLADDFADQTGISRIHVTVTWEFFDPGHYTTAGKSAHCQPRESHPILVDFLTPDTHSPDTIADMLNILARSISKHAKFAVENIFINHRLAHSGRVFDDGEVVRW